jgi:Kef-type K+ transport system membrane component KefB
MKLTLIEALFLFLVVGVLYLIYLIPPVNRLVQSLASRYRDFLYTLVFALFVAAVMYYIVLPRM